MLEERGLKLKFNIADWGGVQPVIFVIKVLKKKKKMLKRKMNELGYGNGMVISFGLLEFVLCMYVYIRVKLHFRYI